MIIKALVENTAVSKDFKSKHGISFYIGACGHRMLFDLGSNSLFLVNAKKMGVDISSVDTVIISHGHVDHAGALEDFLRNNSKAKIYIRQNAFDCHFTKVFGLRVDVGIEPELKNHPQIVLTPVQTQIDEGLKLFSDVAGRECYSQSNNALFMGRGTQKSRDDFSHEQSLLIREGGHTVLVAGCAHTGIVNIRSRAKELAGCEPTHVLGGFHLYNPITRKCERAELVREVAGKLHDGQTQYYTCHCTGKKAYLAMQKIMPEQLHYLSVGSVLEI